MSVSLSKTDLLKYWQNRLQLHDWDISLCEDATPDDLIAGPALAETRLREATKIAVIYILHRRYWIGVDYHYEKTLVHELLHIKFSLLENDDELNNRVLHQIIDDMAKALTLRYRNVTQGGNYDDDEVL